jgi:hypothetical protein
MFKHFTKRLERDVRRKCKARYDFTKSKYALPSNEASHSIEDSITQHHEQQHAAL